MGQYIIECAVPLQRDVESNLSPGKFQERLNLFERLLCSQFGGFTSVPGQGAWRDGTGRVLHERVNVYTVSTGVVDEGADVVRLREGLQHIICTELDQRLAYVDIREVSTDPVGRPPSIDGFEAARVLWEGVRK